MLTVHIYINYNKGQKNCMTEIPLYKFKIKQKLIFFISLILIASCFALSVISYRSFSKSLLKEVSANLPDKAKDISNLVVGRLNTKMQVLDAIAANNSITSMDWNLQQPVLETSAKDFGFMALAVVLPDGTTKYADGSTLNLGDRGYVKQAFAGNTNISDMIISRAINLPVLMIASPIRKDKEVIGVLIARLDLLRKFRIHKESFL